MVEMGGLEARPPHMRSREIVLTGACSVRVFCPLKPRLPIVLPTRAAYGETVSRIERKWCLPSRTLLFPQDPRR
jgi:hypothetical protein